MRRSWPARGLVVLASFVAASCGGAAFQAGAGDSSGPGADASGDAPFTDAPPDANLSDAACSHALSFDGVDDFVNVPNDAVMNLTAFTIEAWVRADSATVSSGAEVHIVSHHDHNANQGYVLMIFGPLKLRAYQASGTQEIAGSTNFPSDGAWHHVAGTLTTAGNASVWMDGQRLALASGWAGAAAYSGPLRIGAASYASAFFFKGLIDEVRLSNAATYTAGFSPAQRLSVTGSTVALWHFDEGAGQLVGSSTPKLSGTRGPSSSATAEAQDPAWASCAGR